MRQGVALRGCGVSGLVALAQVAAFVKAAQIDRLAGPGYIGVYAEGASTCMDASFESLFRLAGARWATPCAAFVPILNFLNPAGVPRGC